MTFLWLGSSRLSDIDFPFQVGGPVEIIVYYPVYILCILPCIIFSVYYPVYILCNYPVYSLYTTLYISSSSDITSHFPQQVLVYRDIYSSILRYTSLNGPGKPSDTRTTGIV